MSAESKVAAPVGGVAVMDGLCDLASDKGAAFLHANDIQHPLPGRAAVAELVAAAHDYLDHPHDAEGVNLAARDRLRAALARVQGGAA